MSACAHMLCTCVRVHSYLGFYVGVVPISLREWIILSPSCPGLGRHICNCVVSPSRLVQLWGQRVELMDSRWRVENGFIRVAVRPSPSSFLFEVGWIRTSDLIIQLGHLRFRELTDDGWFRARWALTSGQFVIVVNDAPPCSHDSLADSFASLGYTEGATVASCKTTWHCSNSAGGRRSWTSTTGCEIAYRRNVWVELVDEHDSHHLLMCH